MSKTLKRKSCGKAYKERICGFTVDVNFFELGELGSKFHGAELMDFVVRFWRLACKLIAREIKNLKAFVTELRVNLFQVLVLWGKAAAGCGINNKKHFSFVGGKRSC